MKTKIPPENTPPTPGCESIETNGSFPARTQTWADYFDELVEEILDRLPWDILIALGITPIWVVWYLAA